MLERWITDPTHRSLVYLTLAFLLLVAVYLGVAAILRHYGKNPRYMLPAGTVQKIAWPLILILFSLILTFDRARTVPILIASQHFQRGPQWWDISVLSTLAIAPVIIIALSLQRNLVKGLIPIGK